MKYLSLFSGIGGFELGIQQAYEDIFTQKEKERVGEENEKGLRIKKSKDDNEGDSGLAGSEIGLEQRNFNSPTRQPTCIGYSEIDKYATQIYSKHFPSHKNYGDITKIIASELPDFDLIVGGFPCQSFSIAGKRGGFNDTRGTLFFDIARIIKEKRPRYLLLENVKGLLSHDTGKTFRTIISTLDELGYDLQWQVLNSKNFGVPQNRERVFIVGHLRGTARPKVFPFGSGNKINSEQDAQGNEVAYCLQAGGDKHRGSYIKQLNNPTHSNNRIYGEEGISPALYSMQGGNRQPKVMRQPLKFLDRNQKNIEGDYSFTVDSMNTGGVKVENKIRRLTPKECERLQGFPDNWTEGISDSQRYKCLGNAVSVPVIKAIMEKLILL